MTSRRTVLVALAGSLVFWIGCAAGDETLESHDEADEAELAPGAPPAAEGESELGAETSGAGGFLVGLRTRQFIQAVEQEDMAAVSALVDPEATLVLKMTLTGEQEPDMIFEGREQILGYVQSNFDAMETIRFINQRITVSRDGRTSFVEADGDFVSADGRPYRNVYVFRFDWCDGRIIGSAEYANPITFLQLIGEEP